MGYRIFLADDDLELHELIKTAVSQDGHFFSGCTLGTKILERIQEWKPDILILDIGLPDVDGFALLRMLKETDSARDLPVLILSARDKAEDIVRGFQCGAEDYLTKPFDVRELQMRIQAVLRRRYESKEIFGPPVELAGITLDPSRRLCKAGSREVRLRPKEFELLETFMRKTGRVLTRAYLLETVWGISRSVNTRTVDVTVSRLRKALGTRAGCLIESIEPLGYRFREK